MGHSEEESGLKHHHVHLQHKKDEGKKTDTYLLLLISPDSEEILCSLLDTDTTKMAQHVLTLHVCEHKEGGRSFLFAKETASANPTLTGP